MAKARGGRPSKREFILESAEQLVHERGAAHLTFDALTQATGISKGGLLYHFESKDALVVAMLERYSQRRQEMKALMLGEKSGTDEEIKALIKAELAHNKQGKLAVDSAIIAAVATNPQLMQVISEKQSELFRLFDQSSVGPIQARVAWFAVIGQRLCRQFGFDNNESENDDALAQFLIELISTPTDSTDNSVFG
ncbi:TetR/AcrR family transcriptional regulator [Aliidiomarina celeris]|uniref:TetR/AcrR family transcriptional regulator n=1 Tax=Aliidiomarina celeris TaxID=2249428 RepID=UPI000DE98790|nr:TetR/AcrR family transcriptional regulator [Aliidiomarina celeris]